VVHLVLTGPIASSSFFALKPGQDHGLHEFCVNPLGQTKFHNYAMKHKNNIIQIKASSIGL
jgi:hypothetical protein